MSTESPISALFIISFIALVIIITVVGINIYMLFLTRRDLSEQRLQVHKNEMQIEQVNDDMDTILSKINSGINYKIDASAVSILDLAEFKDLDPYLKDAYKRYIVEILSSAFMKAINKTMNDNDIKNYLKAHQNEMDEMAYAIAKKLKYNGLDALSPIMKASRPSSVSAANAATAATAANAATTRTATTVPLNTAPYTQ